MKTSSQKFIVTIIALGLGIFPLWPKAQAEEVGTSQADLPSLVARFIIDNQTDKPVPFSVKWGKSGNWSNYTQAPHSASTHSHPLSGPNRAPQPYVHYGNTEYKVAWGEVGYSGYGPGGNINRSVRHVFKYKNGSLQLYRE
jgi:hypothetical protein